MATKKDRAARLAKLRQKVSSIDLGGGGGYMRLKEGRNTVRILPEVGDMEFFFQAVGTHHFQDGRRLYCPSFISEGELSCPVCEFVQTLYRSGGKAAKGMADKLRVRKRYWMNVIDRDDEEAGPKILTAGVTIFGPITSFVADPDYGDVTDIDTGTDMVIKRKGTDMQTKYDVMPRRNESPLSDDQEQIDEWLEDAEDLSWTEVSDDPEEDKELSEGYKLFVYPYDRIVREFDLEDILEDSESEEEPPDDEEDDDEEESEVRQEVNKRRSARRRRRRK